MGKKLEIDEGRRVAVTPLGVPGACRCIPGDDDFKTLSTSFCGSINTTAVSLLLMFMVTSFFWTVERVTTYPHAARSTECFCHWGAKTEVAQSRMLIGAATQRPMILTLWFLDR